MDRREPRLDPARLAEYAQGLILLTGGRDGPLARLLQPDRRREARALLERYREWYGPEGVYVELQQNFLQGDTPRNRESAALAGEAGLGVVATNDVLYHCPERHRLQHALAAARRNLTIEEALPYIRPNNHLCLKPPAQMEQLFRQYPEAVANTLRIAEQCGFNLSSDLGYTLPEAQVPEGYTPDSYLRRLCREAAQRRYGAVSRKIEERLQEEFSLIARHGLAGFLLLYRELVHLAQEIMEERGLTHPETPLEERPPGRGRGSSVALLVGLSDRHQPCGPPPLGPHPGAVHLRRPEPVARHRPGLPPPTAGRTDPPGAPALRAGTRRIGRSHRHLQRQGHHPRTWARPWGCPRRT